MSESRYISLRDLLKEQPSPSEIESSNTFHHKFGVTTKMFDELNLTPHSSTKLSPTFVSSSSSSSLYFSDSSPEHDDIQGYDEENAAFDHEKIKILPQGVMFVSRRNGHLKLHISFDLADQGDEKEEEDEEEEGEGEATQNVDVDEDEKVEIMAVPVTAATGEGGIMRGGVINNKKVNLSPS